MTLLHMMSYGATIAGCLFVTLSLASGLLWLSELIEEHSKMAKLVGTRTIYTVIAIHIALWLFDSLPLRLVLFSILCHIVYLQNFSHTWPFISLVSFSFIGSCVLVVVDHFLWFHYFAQRTQDTRIRRPPGRMTYSSPELESPAFMDIAAFFGICVWLVPLFLFLSLSANDNALPTSSGGIGSNGGPIHSDLASPTRATMPSFPRKSLLASIVDPIFNALPALRIRRGSRRNPEGIIAPRTPNRSPIHTPVMTSSPLPPWSPAPHDNSLLSPALNGTHHFALETRKSSINLRSPPRPTRLHTAPVGGTRRSSDGESVEEIDLTRPGLGIRSTSRPSSRLGRRAVHTDDDLEIPRTSSPIEV